MELSLIVTTETIVPLEIVTDCFLILTKSLSATRAIQCMSFLSVFRFVLHLLHHPSLFSVEVLHVWTCSIYSFSFGLFYKKNKGEISAEVGFPSIGFPQKLYKPSTASWLFLHEFSNR
jgi:hypothetical protein